MAGKIGEILRQLLLVHFNSLLDFTPLEYIYHETSNISRTLVSNYIVYHSDVVGASPVGAAPTTSSVLT